MREPDYSIATLTSTSKFSHKATSSERIALKMTLSENLELKMLKLNLQFDTEGVKGEDFVETMVIILISPIPRALLV